LRRAVSIVMQDVFLFSETINGNVKLGEKDSLLEEAVKKAMEDSASNEFVSKMEDGEETVVGERGVGLSGGQKQRLTMARAMSRNAPIIVFDDSTSALDAETEKKIQHTLNEMHGMTKIIIAHRISSVKKADKIIVLEDGHIAEEGTHEELLARRGLYYETYVTQYGENNG
ncbi:MAG: ABC transporter ATP-binding protein, partial [Spirochaetaceae bacterium]|nr:ABC transporter ATP-binding protein [Spirochaetaceae bacterium]